jgi:DNA sulfur modification protein DndC
MKFCSNCLKPVSKKDLASIQLIKSEYIKDETPWYVGYSGGKDSSAVLTLLVNALVQLQSHHKKVVVVYCDTGVEIPTISDYVRKTITSLTKECKELNIPIEFKIAKPKLDDRYFVKVIGRGYPPPTNIFRWCTDRLRINPVKSIIDDQTNATVLLGVRLGESNERDNTIRNHSTDSRHYLNQGTSAKVKIFSPIINYNIRDVWSTIKYNSLPLSIDGDLIGQLYKDAGAECPVYKESKGTPCGKGRFGCWTCTVVRKDTSVQNMVGNGYPELQPLFEFRNWLAVFRDNLDYRCTFRRNGMKGLGPITLKGRKIILGKLLTAQQNSSIPLIGQEELDRIKELWSKDRKDKKYLELELAQ